MRVLEGRLRKHQEQTTTKGIESERRKQIGSGDSSEKIRTYNYPQRRVTDHRGPITIYRLEETLEGNLDLIVKQLILSDRKSRI